jgi:hypothetical protein
MVRVEVRNEDAPGLDRQEFALAQVEEQLAVDEEPRMTGVARSAFSDLAPRAEDLNFHSRLLAVYMPQVPPRRKEKKPGIFSLPGCIVMRRSFDVMKGARMKSTGVKIRPGLGKQSSAALFSGALFLWAFSPLAAQGGGNFQLVIRIFRIPKQQSFEAVVLNGQGRSTAFQACGDVTSAFPRAAVFFRTELAANASARAIADAILDRVAVAGGIAIKTLCMDELKTFVLDFDREHPRAEGRFEEGRAEGRMSNYRVLAELLPTVHDKLALWLRFDAGWSAQAGSLGVSMSEDVISAPFEVPDSKLLLIGHAAADTIYWLAVTAIGIK